MYIARMRRINTYHEHPCCYCFGTLNLPDSRMPKQSALDAFYYVRNTFYRIAAAKLQQKIDICKCRWRKIYFSANNCAIFYYFVYSLVVLFFFSSVLNVRFSGHGPVMILFTLAGQRLFIFKRQFLCCCIFNWTNIIRCTIL